MKNPIFKTIAGTMVAAAMLGTMDKAQAQGYININVLGMSEPNDQLVRAPGSLFNGAIVTNNTPFNIYFSNLLLGSSGRQASGSSYSTIMTSVGLYTSSTNSYDFYTSVSGTTASLELDGLPSNGSVPYAYLYTTSVTNGFAFNNIQSYQYFFNQIDVGVQRTFWGVAPVDGVGGCGFGAEITATPELSSITVGNINFTNGGFNFNITGPSGTNVVIEASTNLQSWLPLSTNALVNGTNYFSDATWTNYPSRYYRVRTQ